MTDKSHQITISIPTHQELTGDLSGETSIIALNLGNLQANEVALSAEVEKKKKDLNALRDLIAQVQLVLGI